MYRRGFHIALIALLGLYFNGGPALWLAYSTFANNFFAERCENPTKVSCHGSCKVKHIEEHSGSSEQSSSRIQIAETQPMIFTSFTLAEPKRQAGFSFFKESHVTLSAIPESPFHPPRA